MDAKGYATIEDFRGRAIPSITDWQYLNLNYVAKAEIDQDLCIQCGRCHIVCEDTSHQAIFARVNGKRQFVVNDAECVGCNLCVLVCPVEDCITLVHKTAGRRSAHRPRLRPAARRTGRRIRTIRRCTQGRRNSAGPAGIASPAGSRRFKRSGLSES